jgi:acyl dehydratase
VGPRSSPITDEAIASLRSQIGIPSPRPLPYLEEATKDAIRHFAHGMGDRNPLWTDEDYARGTRHGDILAPPCMLYAMDRIVGGYVMGLPGVHAMFAGTDWEWQRRIRRGDRLVGRSFLKDVVEKTSTFSGRSVQQVYHTDFHDQHGVRVAAADSWCIRTQRDVARERDKYGYMKVRRWTPEEMGDIRAAYAREEIRGATPRYWEDTRVGEELPPIIKGPWTPMTSICFVQGWGGLYIRAHAIAFEMYARRPALGIPDRHGIPQPPERVHWEDEFAQAVGVPAAYDYGPERVSWASNLLTNWMGDEGFLRRLAVRVERFNIVGDLTRFSGRVTAKHAGAGGEGAVDVSVRGTNQRGETTVQGAATVVLPRRPSLPPKRPAR